MSPEGRLLQKITYSSGLQDQSVYWPYLDTSGMLWLGLDNGISKVELSSSITTFSKQSGLKTGVLSIDRMGGNLFIGTPIGISVLNKEKRVFDTGEFGGAVQVFDMLKKGENLIFPVMNGMAVLNKDLELDYKYEDDRYLAFAFLDSKFLKKRIFVGNSFGLSLVKLSVNGDV